MPDQRLPPGSNTSPSVVPCGNGEHHLRPMNGRQLADMVEHLPVGVFRLSAPPDLLIFDGNPATARMFGFSSIADMCGLVFGDLLADSTKATSSPAEVVSFSLQGRIDVEARRRDGSTFWITIETRSFPQTEDNEAWLGCVVRDVTARVTAQRELSRRNQVLQSILDNMPSAVTLFDADLEMMACNDKLKTLLGFPDSLFVKGLPSLYDLLYYNAQRGEYGPGDPADLAAKGIERARNPVAHVFERTRADGTVLEVRGTPLPGGGFVTTYTDITERRRAEDAARRANELVRDAIAFSSIFVWESDAEGLFTFAQGCEKVIGFTVEEVLGKGLDQFLICDDASRTDEERICHAIAQHRPYSGLSRCYRTRNGEKTFISASGHPIHDAAGTFVGYRGVDVNVTELVNAKNELERLALHDALTGLANRRKFVDRFELETVRRRRNHTPISLMVADIDHFKRVNDTYGHLVGDACLKHIADVMTTHVRAIDIVARFGGEEFTILLPETDPTGAAQLAEKLRYEIEANPMPNGKEPLPVTISIGIATTADDRAPGFDELVELVEKADRALYDAKKNGRNRVCSAL